MTNKQYWANLHTDYQGRDWIDKPTLFIQSVMQYFPKTGRVLELGAGQGQDTRFLAGLGYHVISTDIDDGALAASQKKLRGELAGAVSFQHVDLAQALPFKDAEFDVVYSHLALHYFDRKTTIKLFNEIHRVLKPNGILALLVNSTSDPEYNTGKLIEPDYFDVDGAFKRYFSVGATRKFTEPFTPILLDDQGESYKDNDKGVHNLVRYVGARA